MSGETMEWGSQAWVQKSLQDAERDRAAIDESLATGHWSLPWFKQVEEPHLVLGQRMGHYHVQELAGEGGFGQVYRVKDTRNHALYALKLMRAASPQQQLELQREIAVLRTLQLPGVVNYRDSGESNGRPFVVMDYLEGEPFLAKAGVDWADCAQGILRLLETLDQLHQCGIAHLDLKPGNIVLTVNGPVLIDFGLSTGPRLQASLSPSGQIAGTPQYLAPEQLLSGQADHRSDIYSLGVLLYRAFSGAFPFPGGSFQELALRGPEGPPPLALVHPGLAQTIQAMLNSDPAERPQSAAEVLAVLEPLAPARIQPSWSNASGPVPESQIRASVCGPERIFAYPSRASRHLSAAGVQPQELTRTVQRWMRRGICTWDEEASKLRVDRRGLDRLEGWLPEELHHLRWTAPERLSDALGPLIQARRDRGHLERAWTLNLEGLGTLERWPELNANPLFRELLLTALGAASPIKLALLVDRLPDTDSVQPIRHLALAAEQTLRAAVSDETRALLAQPLADPELEKWRHAIQIFSVRHRPVEEHLALVESKQGWGAKHLREDVRAAFQSWSGRAHYRNNDLDQAIVAFQAAATEHVPASTRTSILSNLALAYIDKGEHRQAQQTLDQAQVGPRHSVNAQAQLEVLRYRASYGAGSREIDVELLDALSQQPNQAFLGQAQLTSASIAYRNQDPTTCAAHARAALAAMSPGPPALRTLALALLAHCDASEEPPPPSPYPEIEIQRLALCDPAHSSRLKIYDRIDPKRRLTLIQTLTPEECMKHDPKKTSPAATTQYGEGTWEIRIGPTVSAAAASPVIGWLFSEVKITPPNQKEIREQYRFFGPTAFPFQAKVVIQSWKRKHDKYQAFHLEFEAVNATKPLPVEYFFINVGEAYASHDPSVSGAPDPKLPDWHPTLTENNR